MGLAHEEVKGLTIFINFLILFVHTYLNFFFTCYFRKIVYDDEGNLLEEKVEDANEVEKRKTMAAVRNKIEDLIQRASSSKEAMDFLLSSVRNIDDSLGHIVPSMVQPIQEEYENYIGCKIPEEIQIHPPNDVRSKGRSKRIKRAKELTKPRKRLNAKKLMKEPPSLD
jgi:hypothetical protein